VRPRYTFLPGYEERGKICNTSLSFRCISQQVSRESEEEFDEASIIP